jgi:hypothetical protein
VYTCIEVFAVPISTIVSASPEVTPRHAAVHHAAARSRSSPFNNVPLRRLIAAVSLAGALAVVTFAATQGNAGASTGNPQVVVVQP